MAEDEALREALLELQLLREREAKSLRETRNLLECLEAYSSAATPSEALKSIFHSLRKYAEADLSFIGQIRENGTFRVAASDELSIKNLTIVPPFDLSKRRRDILNLKLLGSWKGEFDMDRFSALQSIPLNSEGQHYALLVLKEKLPPFRKGSITLVERLAGLALRALQGSEIADENKLLAAVIHGSSSGFAIADATVPDRPLIYVNKAFEGISGYPADEALGSNCRFLTAEPENSPERVRLREAVSQNAAGRFLLRNQRKDGTIFWNELTLFPVEGEKGEIKSLVATQNDVSQRVEAAAERDRTRAQMDKALTATEDAFLVLAAGNVVEFANDAAREVFPSASINWRPGSTFEDNWEKYVEACEDMPGRISSIVATPDLGGLAKLPTGREIDLPDGRTVLARGSEVSDGGIVLYATDVTPMKSAQRLLSQRLAAIEATQDGIATTDEQGRLTYLNSAAAALLGFPNSNHALGTLWYKRYEMGKNLKGHLAFSAILDRTIEEGERTHEVTGTVLEAGGSVIVFRDITERLGLETREADLRSGLQQLQRQQAMGQLTAGIAHDFNNLLSAINGSAVLIGLEENLTEGLKAHVNRISSAGTQAARLVNRLLDVGENSESAGVFDFASVYNDIPSLIAPSVPADIELRFDAIDENSALKGDPGSLSQVIVNLILNARDAIGDGGGTISLEAYRTDQKPKLQFQVGELISSEKYLRIDVHDTGSGLDETTIANVFEPYFSTKGRHGTGLGLAMVSIEVQAIGGAVGISSELGVGTTVSIIWPLSEFDSTKADKANLGDHDLSGLMLIVVDDDPEVAAVAAKYLEAQGAEVSVCNDPRDAIDAVEEDPLIWSAVITDYDMPEMNGGDVAERIKRTNPSLPVVLVTALARRLSDPRINDGTIDKVMAKPIDVSHLSSVISDFRK